MDHRSSICHLPFWEQPTPQFMTCPGLLPFAVLSQTQNREGVLRGVAQQIQHIPNGKLRSQVETAAGILQ